MAIVEIEKDGKVFEIDVPEGQDVEAAVAEVTASAAPSKRGPLMQKFLGSGEQKSPVQEYKNFSNEMQQTGESIAEKVGEKTSGTPLEGAGPYIGAALGTTAAMGPDIIANQIGTPAAKVMGPKAIQGAGRALSAGGNKLRNMAELLTGPGEDAAKIAQRRALEGLDERLLMQQEAASTLGQRTVQRGQKLAEAKKEYGMAINKAEDVGGFGMKHTPEEFKAIISDPKAMESMTKTLRKIGDTPVEKLVASGDKMALQEVRKFGQVFRELGPKLNKEITREISANVKMGAGKSTEALAKIDETFGSALKEWQKVDNQIKRMGADAKNQKAAIAQSMRHTKNAMKLTKKAMEDAVLAGARRDKVRELVIKAGLGGLIGGTAAGAGWALFK